METEKGVMIVAYKETRGNNRYCLLERKKNWEGWETPKGHLEDGDYVKTVKLELMEEAGIAEEDIENVQELGTTVKWEYKQDGEDRRKEYKGYVCRLSDTCLVDTSQNPCDEHSRGAFVSYEDAMKLLEHENNRSLLAEARQKIS